MSLTEVSRDFLETSYPWEGGRFPKACCLFPVISTLGRCGGIFLALLEDPAVFCLLPLWAIKGRKIDVGLSPNGRTPFLFLLSPSEKQAMTKPIIQGE